MLAEIMDSRAWRSASLLNFFATRVISWNARKKKFNKYMRKLTKVTFRGVKKNEEKNAERNRKYELKKHNYKKRNIKKVKKKEKKVTR